MTKQATTQVEIVGPFKPLPKYLAQREARTRCTFGPVWMQSIFAGTVTDKVKLVEHAFSLGLGARYDLRRLRFETLLAKVEAKLMSTVQ